MQVDVQVYKVQALPFKTTPTETGSCAVNNCDGTSIVTTEYTGTIMDTGESTASMFKQNATQNGNN
jgi:hypothetical protein